MNYCTFTNNSGNYGGGMYCWISNPAITNCVFTDNTANYGGGIRCKEFSNPTLENCTLMNNTAKYDGGGMYNTSDSIPALVYTLVCANNPNQIVGPWTDGGGNTIVDECPECPDINGDDIVDVSDLLIVIGYWGSTDSPADINDDGIVDVSDMLIVISNWGPCE
jgi:predicted outer membrane repeat protein